MDINMESLRKMQAIQEQMKTQLQQGSNEGAAGTQKLMSSLRHLGLALLQVQGNMASLGGNMKDIPKQVQDLVASFDEFKDAQKLVNDLSATIAESGASSEEADVAISGLKEDIQDLANLAFGAANALKKNVEALEAETRALERNSAAQQKNNKERDKQRMSSKNKKKWDKELKESIKPHKPTPSEKRKKGTHHTDFTSDPSDLDSVVAVGDFEYDSPTSKMDKKAMAERQKLLEKRAENHKKSIEATQRGMASNFKDFDKAYDDDLPVFSGTVEKKDIFEGVTGYEKHPMSPDAERIIKTGAGMNALNPEGDPLVPSEKWIMSMEEMKQGIEPSTQSVKKFAAAIAELKATTDEGTETTKKHSKYTFFDTETTGLDTTKDQPIEIGAVKTDPYGNIVDTFSTKMKPSIDVETGAAKVHGVNTEMAKKQGIDPREGYKSFLDFTQGTDALGGHNVDVFDIPLIKNHMKGLGVEGALPKASIDTLKMMREQYPASGDIKPAGYKLNEVADFTGVQYEADQLHGAVADATVSAGVFKALMNKMHANALKENKLFDEDAETAEVFTKNVGTSKEGKKPEEPKSIEDMGIRTKVERKELGDKPLIPQERPDDLDKYLTKVKGESMRSLTAVQHQGGKWLESPALADDTEGVQRVLGLVAKLKEEVLSLESFKIKLLDDEALIGLYQAVDSVVTLGDKLSSLSAGELKIDMSEDALGSRIADLKAYKRQYDARNKAVNSGRFSAPERSLGGGVKYQPGEKKGERWKAEEVVETERKIQEIKSKQISTDQKLLELARMKAKLAEQQSEEQRRGGRDSAGYRRAGQSLDMVKKETTLLGIDKREEDIAAREEAQKQREIDASYKALAQEQQIDATRKHQEEMAWQARAASIQKQEEMTAREIADYDKQLAAEQKAASAMEGKTMSATGREQAAAAEARLNEIKRSGLAINERIFQVERMLLQLKREQQGLQTGTADHSSKKRQIQDATHYLQTLKQQKKEESEAARKKKELEKSTKKNSTALSEQRRHMKNLLDPVRQLSNGMKSLTHSSQMFTRAIKVAMGTITFKTLKEATMQSVEFVEVLNLFAVVMRDAREEGEAFVWNMQEIYGLDPSNIMRYAGMFHNLAAAMGMPDDAATDLSLGLTHLGTDMASLFNMPYDTVMENLSSGMQGMTRAVRKYGMDVRMVTLEATAASLGIHEKAAAMSESNRQALRYITMMRQASRAVEDYSRTMESPANQLKVLREQLALFARAVGNFIIIPLSKALPYINGFVMALRMIIESLSMLVGYKPFEYPAPDELPSFSYMADELDEAGGAAGDLKKTIAGFDELNILSDPASGGGAAGGGLGGGLDPRLAEEMALMERTFTEMRMKANEIRDDILDFLGFEWLEVKDGVPKLKWNPELFRANLVEEFTWAKESINAVFDNWDDLVESFRNLGSTIWTAFKESFDPVLFLIKQFYKDMTLDEVVAQWITDLPGKIDRLSEAIENNQWLWDGLTTALLVAIPAWMGLSIIGQVAGWFSSIIKQGAAVKAFFGGLATNIGLLVRGAGDLATKLLGKGLVGAFKGIAGPVAVVAAAFTTAYLTCDEFRERIDTAVKRVKESFMPALENFGKLVFSVWDTIVKPVAIKMKEDFLRIWDEGIKPLMANLFEFVAELVIIGLDIINAILPVITFFIQTFGPEIAAVFTSFQEIATTVFLLITDAINGFIELMKYIITFIEGLITGDWQKVWDGLSGVVSTVVDGMAQALQRIIDMFNTILGKKSEVEDFEFSRDTKDLMESTSVIDMIKPGTIKPEPKPGPWKPDSSPVKSVIPEWTMMAAGGVVRKPTMAVIGEGKYAEGVIPLEDSPQMQDLITKIAAAVNSGEDGGGSVDVVIPIYIAGEKIDEVVVKNLNRGTRRVGNSRVVIA